MKIVDAAWEKRNLDCNVVEITLDNEDLKRSLNYLKDEVHDCVASYKASYAVMKFDSKESFLLQLPALCGFSFMETQLMFQGELNSASKYADTVLRKNNVFRVESESTEDDFDFIAGEIRKGLFKTDRIALDPIFGENISNKRYANWLLDLKNDRNRLLSLVYMNKNPIGYELAKFDGDEISAIHGGLLLDYQKMPIGLMEMASLVRAYEPKFKMHLVSVSSNNIPVVKGWQFFGYKIMSIHNVFVKHVDFSR